MDYLIICTVALLSSALTFVSGFGLGTLLLPAFALFFPVEQAVSLTALVHVLNNLFKLGLVGRHAEWQVVFRFGMPAVATAIVGAWLLVSLAHIEPIHRYVAAWKTLDITPVKLTIGLVLLVFASLEMLPGFRKLAFGPRYMVLGGMISGFFGGLSGMQGALRSAFLSRAGLSKEAFIGTGVVIACFIDLPRLGIYFGSLTTEAADFDHRLLLAAATAALLGAMAGNRFIRKMTMPGIQRIVAVLLFLVALGLISGWL